jgi:DNA-binding CsgD family transcriptional regulator
VITHRKNIMEKLGGRSLADVIVYCVMNGVYSV